MRREKIAKEMTERFGIPVKYLGAPSFTYEVKIGEKIHTLDGRGDIIPSASDVRRFKDMLNGDDTMDALEVTLPLDDHTGKSLRNLVNMVYSRQHLIKKVFSLRYNIIEPELITRLADKKWKMETVEDFRIAIGENSHPRTIFDEGTINLMLYTTDINPDGIDVYNQFLAILDDASKELKYASAKVVEADNEKYAFRTWLVRLGMVGDEYKTARKILLENLSGNGVFRRNTED